MKLGAQLFMFLNSSTILGFMESFLPSINKYPEVMISTNYGITLSPS